MKKLYFNKLLVHSIFALIIMAGLYAMGIDIYPSDLPYVVLAIIATATVDILIKVFIALFEILKEKQ